MLVHSRLMTPAALRLPARTCRITLNFFTTVQKSFTRPDINIGVDHKIHETVVQSVVSKGAEEKVIPLTEENGHKRCHGNRSIHQRRSHGYAKQCCLETRE